jgi:hypothetical protein
MCILNFAVFFINVAVKIGRVTGGIWSVPIASGTHTEPVEEPRRFGVRD